MKNISFLLTIAMAPTVFAADLQGTFQCNDGGTLTLERKDIRAYYASLQYEDGSASTLAELSFPGESLRGTLYRDDEDAEMGRVIEADGGNRLVLRFDGGEVVTCVR